MDPDASTDPSSPRVLVLGATGYVGGRLVPELLAAGYRVRCASRSRRSLASLPWAHRIEAVEADLFDPSSLAEAFHEVDQVVYLVHSLDVDGFEEIERTCAANARRAAEQAGVHHIVYLSGLGDDAEELSPHLRSRHTVGRELADGTVPVTELRAAVVLGAGSASFEMLRNLVEILPVMVVPRWVSHTRVQPIAVSDVVTYLLAAVEQPQPDGHRVVEIGGPDAMTYRELMDTYARVAGLRRRLIRPVPLLSPRLSSHWVNLVTPLPRKLASSLIDSLMHDVVVTDDSRLELSHHQPLPASRAIEVALSSVANLDIPTHWSGRTVREQLGRAKPWDPEWSGGAHYEECNEMLVDAPVDVVREVVRGVGGKQGWYGFGPLWAVRGLIDKAFGGAGLRRGRRHPDEIGVGEALDFWRVDELDDAVFRLRAEMKLPGDAWLEWTTLPHGRRTQLVQRARYVPRGLWGRAYWWALVPVHKVMFPVMIRRIAEAAEQLAGARSQPADASEVAA